MTISLWQQTEDPEPIAVEPVINAEGYYEMPIALLREEAESDHFKTLEGNWIDPPEYMAVYVCGQCHKTLASEDNPTHYPTHYGRWEVAYTDSIRPTTDKTLWSFTIICPKCVKYARQYELMFAERAPEITFCRMCAQVFSRERTMLEHQHAGKPLYYSTVYLASNIKVIDCCDGE